MKEVIIAITIVLMGYIMIIALAGLENTPSPICIKKECHVENVCNLKYFPDGTGNMFAVPWCEDEDVCKCLEYNKK
jgi:hypothetical protein